MSELDRIGQLLLRISAGERQGLSELMAAQGARVYGICVGLAPRDDVAAFYEQAWRSIWQLSPDFAQSGLGGEDWLALILREQAVAELRTRRGRESRSDTDRLADLHPHIPANSDLGDCLERLNAEDAEAITRAVLSGETEAELAQDFGLPEGMLHARLDQALAAVDQCLGGDGHILAARLVLGLASAPEAQILAEGIEDNADLAAARKRWCRAVAGALSFAPQPPPRDAQARIERRLFAGDEGGFIRRIGLIPSLVAALIGALLLYAAGAGMFGPEITPAPPAMTVDQ